jgi:hypothetical protein
MAAPQGRIDGEFCGSALSDLAMSEITTDQHTDTTLGAKRCSSRTNAVSKSKTRLLGNWCAIFRCAERKLSEFTNSLRVTRPTCTQP